MAIKIGANLAYNGKLPNFERDSFETKAAMKAFDENSIDEGHLSYCKEDGNIYQYKHTNTVNTTTGRWRLFKTEADAVLNGTSTNAIQNKAVFEALKAKADAVALDKYQPKYKADYVAKEDLSELPITEGVIDLNGYQLNMTSVDSQGTDLTIINGTISFSIGVTIKVSTLTFNNINITGNVEDRGVKINADSVKLINVFSPVMDAFNTYSQNDTNLIQQLKIYNSNIAGSVNAKEVFVYQSYISLTGNAVDNGIKLHAYNSYILDDGYGTNNGSEWYNSRIELFEYPNGYIDNDGAHRYNSFDDTLKNNSENAPQTKVVYDAFQLKADKTQLNDLATKTELSSKADKTQLGNYLTKDDANTKYAQKSEIVNVYKFRGSKNNYSELPTDKNITGDVWNIRNAYPKAGIKAGDNVAWDGVGWDNLSGVIDLSAYVTKNYVNDELNKKVNIIGISKNNTLEGKEAYLKVATITMPKTQYQSGLLELFITDRSNERIDVLVIMDNTKGQTNPVINVIEIVYRASIKTQPIYYYKDLTGKAPIITLYFKITAYDTATVKVVDKDAYMPFTYTLDMEVLQTLPEGVIQVHHINYGNKNLFYATPKDAAGDPKFRAIDITDLPDLSSKYQALNGNGYQQNPLMINARVGADSNSGYKYLTALTYGLPNNIPYKASPDWYFATDGTLQDITTKIPKVVLDDAVSTTSDNGVKNSVITQYVDSKVTTINSSIADVRTSLESTQTDFVDLRNKVNTMPKTVFITQAAYNALITKDANTIYYING